MAGRAGRVPEALVSLALRLLPSGDVRRRYERELLAELHSLPRDRQLRYALGALITSWSLRDAVTGRSTREGATTTSRTPFLCRFHIKHRWWWFHTDDGEPYIACIRCGKDGPASSRSSTTANMATPIAWQ